MSKTPEEIAAGIIAEWRKVRDAEYPHHTATLEHAIAAALAEERAEAERLREHIRLQAEDIMTLGQTVGRFTEALVRAINCTNGRASVECSEEFLCVYGVNEIESYIARLTRERDEVAEMLRPRGVDAILSRLQGAAESDRDEIHG